jgi:hypothetical protein
VPAGVPGLVHRLFRHLGHLTIGHPVGHLAAPVA